MLSRSTLLFAILTMLAALSASASAQIADPAKWAEIQKAALAEGELDVTGPPSPPLRAALSAAFKARHGITLNYFADTTSAIVARIDEEFKANKLSIDAHIGGLSANALGIPGLNAIGRKLMEEAGVTEIVVEGSARTTGRCKGPTPHPIRFPRGGAKD